MTLRPAEEVAREIVTDPKADRWDRWVGLEHSGYAALFVSHESIEDAEEERSYAVKILAALIERSRAEGAEAERERRKAGIVERPTLDNNEPCPHARAWPVRWLLHGDSCGSGLACRDCAATRGSWAGADWQVTVPPRGAQSNPLPPHPLALCGACSYRAYICTEPYRHLGDHVARDGERELDRWPQRACASEPRCEGCSVLLRADEARPIEELCWNCGKAEGGR